MLDPRRTALTVLFSIAAATSATAQGPQLRDWKASVLAEPQQRKPQAACAWLASLTRYEWSISTAVAVPQTAEGPEYCRVTGLIQPEVRFEVALPAVWNGRLLMFGNGGYAGEPLDQPGRIAASRSALARGFATALTNTGHDATVEPLGTFAVSPQKLVDYAYRAVHVTALTAKTILQAYYGGAAVHSYFYGCSTGGRQGLISAQRFPDDFDGIVVGAPVLDFSSTMIDYAVNQRALVSAPLTPEKLKVVADAVYRKCDAADGVADGLIDDPRLCAFKPDVDVPHCPNDADAAGCLTSAQAQVLETIYSGVKRNGVDFFPGWPVGAEVAADAGPAAQGRPQVSGWVPWFVAPPSARPIQAQFGETFFRYLAFGRPNPSYEWTTFDVEKDLDKIQATRAMLDAADPDLSRFKARGGKILSYFGWADPALNPLMGVRYYEAVTGRFGPSTADFYRLFMVPGMFHCGGGVGVTSFEVLTPLVEWVERGSPPQVITGARIVDGKTVRTRPLCPYPQVAKYKGSGSIDDAANFACAAR